MFPPFPEKDALECCAQMLDEIHEGSLSIEHEGQISLERTNPAVMIGALVCRDADGKRVSIRTVSGNSRFLKSTKNVDGIFYAPAIVSSEQIRMALSENDGEIHALTEKICALEKDGGADSKMRASELSKKRTVLTTDSLKKFHALYYFHSLTGKKFSLREICDRKKIVLPPTGVGECCAPKLLDFAAKNGLSPISMAEIVYDPNKNDAQKNLESVPPCDPRCSIILPDMLGLEILYRDESIVVINKESGLLSIPGKIEKDCASSRLKKLFPDCIEQPCVHRLDMETSGILVMALTKDAHRNLSMQFQNGETSKEYEALVDGVLPKIGIRDEGEMELFFRVDLDNRPHQIWDEVYGKKAVTRWRTMDVESYTAPDGGRRFVTRVKFFPQTGRTHQLRLAAADAHGFSVPIIGDTLYGKCMPGERLMLHATKLTFTHPDTNQKMTFNSPAPF